MTTPDHYAALKVGRNASRAQIKSSFYQISRKHHPDVVKARSGAESDIFVRASEAYSVLGDEHKRRMYDRSLSASQALTSYPSHPRTQGKPWERRRPTPSGTTAWTTKTKHAPGQDGPSQPFQNPYASSPSSNPYGSSVPPHSSSSFSSFRSSRPPPFSSDPTSWTVHPNHTINTTTRSEAQAAADRLAVARISPSWRAFKLIVGIGGLCLLFGTGIERTKVTGST